MFPATEIREGDVLLNITGASIGRSAVATAELDGGNVNQHVCEIRVRRSLMNPHFVCAVLNSDIGQNQIDKFQAGGNRQGLNFKQVGSIAVMAPQIREQDAISGVLCGADELISSLRALIAKKRAIKQGMMQELLTGRTRLPDFAGNWEETTLGAVSRIKTGSRNNQDKVANGEYPFFVRSATVEKIDTYSYDTEAILVPGEGGIGSIFHYINGMFEVHQRVYTISDFSPNVAGKFVYYYMREFFGLHAMEHSVKATVDSLRLPTFKSFELRLPPTRAEQDAIAITLGDADTEIEALERRLEATRAIKQGMMQELLTGRTRLPVNEEVAV